MQKSLRGEDARKDVEPSLRMHEERKNVRLDLEAAHDVYDNDELWSGNEDGDRMMLACETAGQKNNIRVIQILMHGSKSTGLHCQLPRIYQTDLEDGKVHLEVLAA